MKQDHLLWQLGALTFTAILGTLLHFLYHWTNCILFAPVSAVNESTWEHMKILFFPMLVFAVIQSFFYKNSPYFWQIKGLGILVGTLLIPVLFYTINGSFGATPGWVNISLFFLSAGIALSLEYLLLKNHVTLPFSSTLVKIVLLCIFTAFILFTFFPPKIPLFQDPRYRVYGIV